jgi:hypothetical protein
MVWISSGWVMLNNRNKEEVKRVTCASVEWKPQIHAQEEEGDWNFLNEKQSN